VNVGPVTESYRLNSGQNERAKYRKSAARIQYETLATSRPDGENVLRPASDHRKMCQTTPTTRTTTIAHNGL
jgi:hypothetical protein